MPSTNKAVKMPKGGSGWAPGPTEFARVAGAVERRRQHQRTQQDHEEARERVQPQVPGQPRQADLHLASDGLIG